LTPAPQRPRFNDGDAVAALRERGRQKHAERAAAHNGVKRGRARQRRVAERALLHGDKGRGLLLLLLLLLLLRGAAVAQRVPGRVGL
jgi:hypothetical protein